MSLVDDLANAIAQYESGGKPGALSIRNNNPGNLRSWGNYPVVNGYVVFPDWETGMNALRRQVSLNISRGLSLNEFFAGKTDASGRVVYAGYAPAADRNAPTTYARTVAGWLGIDASRPLSQVGESVPFGSPSVEVAQETTAGGFDWRSWLAASGDTPEWVPLVAAGVAGVSLLALMA